MSSQSFVLPLIRFPRRASLRFQNARCSWCSRAALKRNGALWALAAPGAAAGLCALFVDARALAPGAAIGAIAVLGVLWPWASLRGLRGTLAFSASRAREGDEIEAHLTLDNRAWWPIHGAMPRGLDALDEAGTWGMACAPARQKTTARHRLKARRGAYPAPGMALGCAFPFGIWEARRELGCGSHLLVWPRTFSVGALPEMRGGARHEGLSPSNRVGTSGDVQGARPFREGDSLRRVHWGQTARYDRLIVCEMQATQTPRVEILLDLEAQNHAGHGADSSREWAIRIAASLCESWAQGGASGALRCGALSIAYGSGSRQIGMLLDALARVPLEEAFCPPLSELLESATSKNTPDLRVVVTTDRALSRFEGSFPARVRSCVIALSASGFEGEAAPEIVAPHGVALVRVTGAEDVAAQVRNGLREASRAL